MDRTAPVSIRRQPRNGGPGLSSVSCGGATLRRLNSSAARFARISPFGIVPCVRRNFSANESTTLPRRQPAGLDQLAHVGGTTGPVGIGGSFTGALGSAALYKRRLACTLGTERREPFAPAPLSVKALNGVVIPRTSIGIPTPNNRRKSGQRGQEAAVYALRPGTPLVGTRSATFSFVDFTCGLEQE